MIKDFHLFASLWHLFHMIKLMSSNAILNKLCAASLWLMYYVTWTVATRTTLSSIDLPN